MNSQSDLNYKPEEANVTHNSQADDFPGDLESIVLENAFAEQIPTLTDSPLKSNYVPQLATYITEIGDRFYLLDYGLEELEPKPRPLTADNLSPKASANSKKDRI